MVYNWHAQQSLGQSILYIFTFVLNAGTVQTAH